MKTIQAANGKTYKLGRRRPRYPMRGLMMGTYLTRKYVLPPISTNRAVLAMGSLRKIYLNDSIGDCVIAGGAHMEGLWSANANGAPILYSDDQIIQEYHVIGGYVPGDPSTDNGCDEVTALERWQTDGFAGGTRIAGKILVDGTDPIEVRAAINEFGCLMAGLELPDEWLPHIASDSAILDVAGPSNPESGHCVVLIDYNPGKVIAATYGFLPFMTDAAVAKYCVPEAGGELYACVTEDWCNNKSHLSPPGLNSKQLLADLASLR